MIPIIYAGNITDFTNNGIGRLIDCTSCIVTEERNGIYECEFSYPITGAFYDEISLDRIVKIKPNESSDDQLFRIYRISKPINGIVKVYCQHISYDLITNIVLPFTLTSASALEALQAVFSHASSTSRYTYTCTTTVGGTQNLKISVPTPIRQCLGGEEESVLAAFGGEFEFDNFNIRLHASRGQDSGVTILYGKNLTDIKVDSNMSESYNAILPYAIDEEDDTPVHLIAGNTKTISISGAPDYGEPRVLAVDLTDRFDLSEEDITAAKLLQRANEYLSENDLTAINQNIEISFVQLWQTEEYKDIALLERVALCDTVTVRYATLGVDVKAKVVKTVYNTLTERYEKIELGDAKSNFLDEIRKEAKAQTKKAIDDNYSDMQRAIDNATKLITGQNGGYVILNGDNNGKPKEILIMNTDDIQTATKVWRWNLGGLGYAHGASAYSGQYSTAITMDGSIVADFITTGTLNASIIKAGIIKDAQEKNYWNLNNGTFRLSQNNAFNSLTHDGDTLGIYMTPVEGEDYNELRINASYIKSGTVDASVVNVTNINASNINTGALNASLITTGTLSADLIKTGSITSTNSRTSLSMTTGNLTINQSTAGQQLSLDDNGMRIKYSGQDVMRCNSNQIYFNNLSGKTVNLNSTWLSFGSGSSSLYLEPNSAYSALKTSNLELSGNLNVTKIINAKSIYVPYSAGNSTYIDATGLSYKGNTLSPVQISVNGSNYYVLAYPVPTTPVTINSLNLSTTSILNSPFLALTVTTGGDVYVVAAYNTTQTGSGTDITTADVSYLNRGFDYELYSINNVSYAFLTAGAEKSNAATVYDELTDSSGHKYMPMFIYFNNAWQQVFGFRS